MSVHRSGKTFSSWSMFGSAGHGPSGGLGMNRLGSSGASLSFVEHNYGSASGYGTRISRSLSTSCLNDGKLYANKKQTMQNLNDRLSSYLDQVHSLEQANKKLEQQIEKFCDKKNPVKSKDMSAYFRTISELGTKIQRRFVENAELRLKMDNTKLAAEDFRSKYETEMDMRGIVEADSARLRRVLGEMKVSIGNLENQLSGLKEELLYMKKNHKEDLYLLREKHSGTIIVEVKCPPQLDLDKELKEMRAQYEMLIEKNRREAERWFQSKAKVLQNQVTTRYTEVKSSQTEVNDLKKTLQNLEIELQGIQAMKQNLEQTLVDDGVRYAAQLSQLQLQIDRLEEELQRLNTNIREQASEYQLLLNIRMGLEMEIDEYKRLLDAQTPPGSKSTPILTKTSTKETETMTITMEIEKEEHNPSIQRRVKVIVEELMDGKVVSSSVDEKIQDIS